MVFDVDKIEINAAFYELYESVFEEDFFALLVKMNPTKRINSLRTRQMMVDLNIKKAQGEKLTEKEQKLLEKNPGKWQELDEVEKQELVQYNMKAGALMKKCTPRIAYIGSKLYRREYRGSKDDYYAFLASYDSSEFLKTEVQTKIWEKVNGDQAVPKSVKNV